MYIFDDMGNMVNERASALGDEFGQRISELFDTFFAEGMIVIEGRALLDYFKAVIDGATAISMIQHQITAIKETGEINARLQ